MPPPDAPTDVAPIAGTRPLVRVSTPSLTRAVLVVTAAVLLVALATRAVHPLMWFAQAAVVAGLAWPVVQRLRRWMPPWVAVLLLTAVAVGVLVAVGAIGFAELRAEADLFAARAPTAADRLEEESPLGGVLADIELSRQVREIADGATARFRIGGADLPGLASRVGGAASAGFIVWVLAVMLLFTGSAIVRGVVGFLAPHRSEHTLAGLAAAYGRGCRYVAATAARALVVAAAAYLIAAVIGVDLPVLVATIAFLVAFVPYVGVVLAALPLALMAVLVSPATAAAVVVGAVVVAAADATLVQPRIERVGFRFGMFPTLLGATLGYALYGPAGLLVGLCAAGLVVAWLDRPGDGRGDASPDPVSGGPDPGTAPAPT